MMQTVRAIYERGVLKLLEKISLPEHKKVTIKIIDTEDDIPSLLLSHAASKNKSFQFLKKKTEDIYSLKDGRPA